MPRVARVRNALCYILKRKKHGVETVFFVCEK